MRQLPCSDVEVEPLPGTAKPGATYVIFEWPDPWPRDVLGDAALGEDLSPRIAKHLDEYDASLLLIRHPTREGRHIKDHHLYLVFADEGITEVLHVDGPDAILDLDLSGPGKNGGKRRERPLLLICTHAKRDVCCAVKGRPLVNALHERYPFGPGNDVAWEVSHIKGHRFAATMLLMPWAYSFGRMNVEATDAMLTAAKRGEYFVPGNRGRGTLSPVEQVAEIAVASEVAEPRYGEFDVEPVRIDDTTATVNVTTAGREYVVELEKRPVSGIVDSCGKAPKEGSAWVALTVQPR